MVVIGGREDVLPALHEPLLSPQDCTVFETENKILHVVSPASSSSCPRTRFRVFLPHAARNTFRKQRLRLVLEHEPRRFI